MNKKIGEYGSIFILVLYAWNELFTYWGISNLRYIISIVVILNGIVAIFRERVILRKLWPFYVFVLYGGIIGIFSLGEKGIILSVMGAAAIFFNLLVWLSVCETTADWNVLYGQYKKIYVFCMSVNGILAIYQYFIDASIGGLVSNRIYGSESSFLKEGVTRRVTALIGSTQNFAVAMGCALILAYELYKKKKCPIWMLGAILIGGCFSGGRTFGIFLIFFCVIVLKDYIRNPFIVGGCFALVGGIAIGSSMGTIKFEALTRLFSFHRWAALQVFTVAIKEMSWTEMMFGKGLGLADWVGTQGEIAFDYSSVESFMLALVYQGGLILLGIFFVILLSAILKVKVIHWEEWCLLAGIVVNMAFTPSFAGFSISYLVWPIILNFYMQDEKGFECDFGIRRKGKCSE